MRAGAILAFALALAGLTASPAPAQDFDADGFRSARYRSPVSQDVAPARRIAMADAVKLAPGKDALFLDVMPVDGGARDPASGAWRLSVGHETIPGSQWHPETGRSPVDTTLWHALVDAVAEARKDRPDLPVVLFCREDCWMSWNAARRLASAGMKDVFWLAEGTDGWHAAGRGLVAAVPVTVPTKGCNQGR